MKSVLAVVLAVALLGLGAHSASAQVPYVQAYFSVDPYTTDADCPGALPGTVLQDLYVVAHNFNNFLISIEYSLSLPPHLLYLGFGSTAEIAIGDPVNGIAPDFVPGVGLGWTYPQNAFAPLLISVIHTTWMCEFCADSGFGPGAVQVMPHGQTGSLAGVSWPAFEASLLVGMTSAVCPEPTPVEETSWGQIKALYE